MNSEFLSDEEAKRYVKWDKKRKKENKKKWAANGAQTETEDDLEVAVELDYLLDERSILDAAACRALLGTRFEDDPDPASQLTPEALRQAEQMAERRRAERATD